MVYKSKISFFKYNRKEFCIASWCRILHAERSATLNCPCVFSDGGGSICGGCGKNKSVSGSDGGIDTAGDDSGSGSCGGA